jgi:hypothetical protein
MTPQDQIKQETVEGHVYSIGKLDTIKQFHVARRLTPILAALGSSMRGAILSGNGEAQMAEVFSLASGPLSEVLAKMGDAESEYILFTCLGVVFRQEQNVWAPVTAGKMMAYRDISLRAMMDLVVLVVQENLGNFFRSEEPASPSA